MKATLNASLEVRFRESMKIRTKNISGQASRQASGPQASRTNALWTRAKRCVVGNWQQQTQVMFLESVWV